MAEPTFTVYHPLVELSPATFSDLLEHCTADAKSLLKQAAALAQHRWSQQDAITQAIQDWQSPPCNMETILWEPSPPTLQPVDLMRALLLECPDFLSAAILEPNDVHDNFHKALAKWRSIQPNLSCPPYESVAFDPIWARRWTLFLAESQDRQQPIQTHQMMGLLSYHDLEGFADFSIMFAEQCFYTRHEMAYKMMDLASSTRDRVEDYPSVPFFSMPFAYFSRGDELFAFEHALCHHPMVLLVGPPESGRRSLVRAWFQQCYLKTYEGLHQLAEQREAYRPPFVWDEETTPLPSRPRPRIALQPEELESYAWVGESFWSSDPPSPFTHEVTYSSTQEYSWMYLERLLQLAHGSGGGQATISFLGTHDLFPLLSALREHNTDLRDQRLPVFRSLLQACLQQGGHKLRLVLSVTPEELSLLWRHCPELEQAEQLQLDSPNDMELIPWWLCRFLELSELWNKPLNLSHILAFLTLSTHDERTSVERFLAILEQPRFQHEQKRIQRVLTRYSSQGPQKMLQRMGPRRRRKLVPYLTGLERWQAIVDLADKLMLLPQPA
ncbi:MAG: hypothetical protein EP343_04750 [Deltaproteobacteria bacterium]|nr:MAG: hypothetical protein EP343_04750 [Deltaproteobacteria bacterium]